MARRLTVVADTDHAATPDTGRDSAAKPRGAGQERARKRRQHLTEVVMQLVKERGFAAISVNEVAERAKISVGGLYRHIGTKSDLLEMICDEINLDLLADMKAAAAKATGATAKLKAAIRTYWHRHWDSSAAILIAYREYQSFSDSAKTQYRDEERQISEYLSDLIRAGMIMDEFAEVDDRLLANEIILLSHMRALKGYTLKGRDRDHVLSEMMALVFARLTPIRQQEGLTMAVDNLVYDPSDPAIMRNPHPIFAWLRREDPVHWSEPMSGWIVTQYDDIVDSLTDSKTFSAERLTNVRNHLPARALAPAEEILRYLNSWMVFRDPPDHTRLRRHMAAVLNLPTFESLRGTVSDLTTMLLDKLPQQDTIDFLPHFSILLPGMVVMELMGVDRDRLLEVKRWSDEMMLFIGSARGVPDKYERARHGAVSMATLFKDLIAKRRAAPQNDMLSQLIASEIDGRTLGDDELVGCLMMVLNGGHETTANLINNSLLALAHNPDALAWLRANPDRMPTAVEEFLRYDSPILSLGRMVAHDTELGGKQLSAGERVFFMLLSANRDEEVFDDPNRLDVTRDPNPHMAFGKGPHFCLGTPLARLEGQIVLNAILERYSAIELVDPIDTIPWINSLVTRGPTRIPLRLRK